MTEREKKAIELIGGNREMLSTLCSSLIHIPTPNPPGDGYERFVRFLSEWFSGQGLRGEVTQVPQNELSSLIPKECHGPRPFFQVSLEGKEKGPVLYLQGHYDTIPVTQGWAKDPFAGEVEGGKLFGLGASDMKGGLASMMMAMKALAHAGLPSRGKVVFLATPDEEYASRASIQYLFSKGTISGDFAVVGEFSGIGNVFVGLKGGFWGDIRVRGKAAHGSQPFKGINAFEKLARVMVEIEDKFKPELLLRKSSHAFVPPEYDFPTLMIGGILKGTNIARSAVPDLAMASFDLRSIPEEKGSQLLDDFRDFLNSLKEKDRDLDIELEVASHFPAYALPENSPIVRSLRGAITERIGRPPSLSISCAATETAFFARQGIPAVAYGPGIWETAHARDEYILVEDLVTASIVYVKTALLLLGQ